MSVIPCQLLFKTGSLPECGPLGPSFFSARPKHTSPSNPVSAPLGTRVTGHLGYYVDAGIGPQVATDHPSQIWGIPGTRVLKG